MHNDFQTFHYLHHHHNHNAIPFHIATEGSQNGFHHKQGKTLPKRRKKGHAEISVFILDNSYNSLPHTFFQSCASFGWPREAVTPECPSDSSSTTSRESRPEAENNTFCEGPFLCMVMDFLDHLPDQVYVHFFDGLTEFLIFFCQMFSLGRTSHKLGYSISLYSFSMNIYTAHGFYGPLTFDLHFNQSYLLCKMRLISDGNLINEEDFIPVMPRCDCEVNFLCRTMTSTCK